MDEIADLIRLLAEAPAEEAPMTRPKELLDRVAIERVAQQGVVQPGPAVPDARVSTATTETGAPPDPKPPKQSSISPSRFNFPQPESLAGAAPNPIQHVTGATANPKTGIPNIDVSVRVAPFSRSEGAYAAPKPADVAAGNGAFVRSNPVESVMPASPQTSGSQSGRPATPLTNLTEAIQAAEAKRREVASAPVLTAMAPETFNARVATPRMLESIAGMTASVRQKETVVAVASPSPRSQVTITVPPAFPIDPKEAFSAVDEQVQLPPRQDPIQRDIRANFDDLKLESTETFVSRSFQGMEGARSDLDRFIL